MTQSILIQNISNNNNTKPDVGNVKFCLKKQQAKTQGSSLPNYYSISVATGHTNRWMDGGTA